MSRQTLRELAKDYAKGVIDKENYRKSRTELIKDIITGKTAVKAIDYEGPLRPSDEVEEAITEGIVRDRTEIASPKPTSASASASKSNTPPAPVRQSVATTINKKSPFIFIIVSIIIVLSLILSIVLFYPKPPESSIIETTDSSNSANDTTEAIVETTTNDSAAAEALVGTFLSEKNWNDENLDKFIESWSALTQEERDAAEDTKRMQRMKTSIYKEFLAAKALASIDSGKARMKQQKLIEFANAIGIGDSRLVLD